jgi:hypothetical protein
MAAPNLCGCHGVKPNVTRQILRVDVVDVKKGKTQ